MGAPANYVEYVLDQLSSFARVTSRRMFGGVGLKVWARNSLAVAVAAAAKKR